MWRGNENEAQEFVVDPNSNPWGIELTSNLQKDITEFLDLSITHDKKLYYVNLL